MNNLHAYVYTHKQNKAQRTERPLRQGLLEVEDGAGLRAGVVVVQVRQLPRQGAAHVLFVLCVLGLILGGR